MRLQRHCAGLTTWHGPFDAKNHCRVSVTVHRRSCTSNPPIAERIRRLEALVSERAAPLDEPTALIIPADLPSPGRWRLWW